MPASSVIVVYDLGWCARGLRHLVFADLLVERLGCHVEAVGSNKGANFRVDVDLGEARRN